MRAESTATWVAFLEAATCWVAFLAAGSTATTFAATKTAIAETPPTAPCTEALPGANCGSSNPAFVKSEAAISAESLRSTIEESVLNRLTTSIREHSEMVERGERRPRPFVTLTYAQSIDGSIAASDRSQVKELWCIVCSKVRIFATYNSDTSSRTSIDSIIFISRVLLYRLYRQTIMILK